MPLGNPITIENESRIISVTTTTTNDTFTVEGGYKINHINVYRNGVRLVSGNDFLANDATTVQLINSPNIGDVIEFHLFGEFLVNDAIVGAATSQTIYGDLTINGDLYYNNSLVISNADYADVAGIATVGGVGIHSAGTLIGIATNLNFIGAGNTFAINGDSIDISISGSGGPGASGAIGIASVQKPSNQVDYVGFAVTDLRFVGAAVTGVTDTASGVSTATVTITKTLVIGRRDSGTAQLNISSGDASSLQLRDGSEVTLPLTLG